MIEGHGQFHYIGSAVHRKHTLLLFREGFLIARTDALPGHHPTDSPTSSPNDSPRTRSSSSASDTRSTDAGTPLSSFSSHDSDSDRVENDGVDEFLRRPGTRSWLVEHRLLGWHPSAPLLHWGNVNKATREALNRCENAATLRQIEMAFVAGQGESHDGDAVLWVMYKRFGLKANQLWPSPLIPAGLVHTGAMYDEATARQALATAELAECNRLNAIQTWSRCRYQGHIPDSDKPTLLFDEGVYIQHHADPTLIGWHPYTRHSRGIHLNASHIALLESAVRQPRFGQSFAYEMLMEGAMSGRLDATARFYLCESVNGRQWRGTAFPAGCIDASDPGHDPALNEAHARRVLAQGGYAEMFNRQRLQDLLYLKPFAWDVSPFVAAIQAASFNHGHAPAAQATHHATLLPVVRDFLLAHIGQEAEWLKQGVIEMPVKDLIALMEADQQMRRPECAVHLTPELVQQLLQTLGVPRVTLTRPTPNDALQLMGRLKNAVYLISQGQEPGARAVCVDPHGWHLVGGQLQRAEDVTPQLNGAQAAQLVCCLQCG